MRKFTNRPISNPAILIVEDSQVQGLQLKTTLEASGCQVHWAENGSDGLQAAQDDHFDLIILDVELPDLDGFEICRQLKANPSVADVPVIMLTTRDGATDAITGLGQGAIDYIPKDPFAEAVLLATIKQMGL